jgi:hypothetical protein
LFVGVATRGQMLRLLPGGAQFTVAISKVDWQPRSSNMRIQITAGLVVHEFKVILDLKLP